MDIGHRPWVAELNFMLMMYPGIANDVLNVYMNSPSFQAGWRITRIADVTGLDTLGVPVVMVTRPNARSISEILGRSVPAAALGDALARAVATRLGCHLEAVPLTAIVPADIAAARDHVVEIA
jgi:ribosomal protein S12 methylthiotransferase accessory factor YcaO